MATSTNVSMPTPTPTEWAALQAAQQAAKALLLTPEGPAGRALVAPFQRAFNAAIPCLSVLIRARGGDPSKSFATFPDGIPLKVDGMYGKNTHRALGMIIVQSFPAQVALKAAGQFLSLEPYRTKIPAWTTAWKPQVDTMVARNYTDIVPPPQTNVPPAVDNTINNPGTAPGTKTETLIDNSSQVPSGAGAATQPPPASTQGQGSQVIPIEDVAIVTGQEAKSYTWLWWVFGAAGLGGALWYFFGKKGRK